MLSRNQGVRLLRQTQSLSRNNTNIAMKFLRHFINALLGVMKKLKELPLTTVRSSLTNQQDPSQNQL